MPVLKNPKHELFAQALSQGISGRKAYQGAGYHCGDAVADSASSRLSRNVKVQKRVAELMEKAADSVVLTKSWVIQETIKLRQAAQDAGCYGPAAKCMELLGREVYAFIERKEVGEPGEFDRLSDNDLRAAATEILASLPRPIRVRRTRGLGTEETPDPESLH